MLHLQHAGRITIVGNKAETKMSSPNAHGSPEIMDVAPLNDRRSTAEVYRAFYELFANENIVAPGGRTSSKSMLWDGRAIRVDEHNDSSTHMVVRLLDGALYPRSLRTRNHDGMPMTKIPYRAHDLLVVSTDGDRISPWHVQHLEGRYDGYFGGTHSPYTPEKEIVVAHLAIEGVAGLRELTFNRATKNGTVEMPNGYVGWILSKEVSVADLNQRLNTEDNIVPTVGGIAIAS